jgi:hypothetical protein
LKVDCVTAGDEVAIYTLAGELVADSLLPGPTLPGLEIKMYWDGRNKQGVPASPGLYYFVVTRGGKAVAKGKFLITR